MWNVNLIHACDIWTVAVERKVQEENVGMCVDTGEGWIEDGKMVKWNSPIETGFTLNFLSIIVTMIIYSECAPPEWMLKLITTAIVLRGEAIRRWLIMRNEPLWLGLGAL